MQREFDSFLLHVDRLRPTRYRDMAAATVGGLSFMSLTQFLIRNPRFAGLLGCNFVLGMAVSFVVPFLSLWGTVEIGMSPFTFGLFMTVTTLSGIAFNLALARWSDTRGSRRAILLLGSAGGALGYFGYAHIRDVALLIVIGCGLVGLAAVCFSQLAAHVREELARPEHAAVDAAVVMSLLRVFFALAWTAGPALGAWIVTEAGFRGLFASAAGLFLLFLLGVLGFVPSRGHPRETARRPAPSLAQSFRRSGVRYYFAVFVLVFCAHTMSMMTLPLWVTQRLHGSERDVGLLFGLAALLEIPFMMWFGRLAGAGYQIRLIRIGIVLSSIYFATVALAGAPWHIFPMQLVTAASVAITTNIAILFFQDMLPRETGIATAIFMNSWSLGSLLGYFAFGLLLPQFGHRGLFLTCAVLAAIASLLVLVRGVGTGAAEGSRP